MVPHTLEGPCASMHMWAPAILLQDAISSPCLSAHWHRGGRYSGSLAYYLLNLADESFVLWKPTSRHMGISQCKEQCHWDTLTSFKSLGRERTGCLEGSTLACVSGRLTLTHTAAGTQHSTLENQDHAWGFAPCPSYAWPFVKLFAIYSTLPLLPKITWLLHLVLAWTELIFSFVFVWSPSPFCKLTFRSALGVMQRLASSSYKWLLRASCSNHLLSFCFHHLELEDRNLGAWFWLELG